MKKIYTAVLRNVGTDNEYAWVESSECKCGEEWNGDIVGYLLNCEDDEEKMQEMIDRRYCGTIHNLPDNAVVLTEDDGRPCEIYWTKESDGH